MTILAPLALLLGAAAPAHAGFFEDLREAVELSKEQSADERAPAKKADDGGAPAEARPAPAGASGAKLREQASDGPGRDGGNGHSE